MFATKPLILRVSVFLAICSVPAMEGQVRYPLSVVPQNRIVSPVDEGSVVELLNHVPPQANSSNDLGRVRGDLPMPGMILVLRRDAVQQAALDAHSEALQDATSPFYRRWLAPSEFGTHFGISNSDIAKLSTWLRSRGFTIDDVPAGRWMIIFSGTVAQVETAFQIEIHRYAVAGETAIANSTDPSIPAALSSVVKGIAALDTFQNRAPRDGLNQARRNGFLPQLVSSKGTYTMEPVDFATIYNVTPLYAAGVNGTGINIAVVAPCIADVSIADTFWALEGLPTGRLSAQNFNAPAPCSSGQSGEAQLDVQWSGAVARNAGVVLVQGGGNNGILTAIAGVVNTRSAPIVSVSYGGCASQFAGQTVVDLVQQAHSAGITIVASSGDAGIAGCDVAQTETVAVQPAGVNYFCESPYAVCVGGTEFNEGASISAYWTATGHAKGYIPEVAWNESATNGGAGLWSTGGGYSSWVPKPTWQTGNLKATRGVPDVSLTAAAHDGYRTCSTSANCQGISSWINSYGTSASAPAFAGILALVVQKTGQWLGSASQDLYALAGRTDIKAFNDILLGNNSVPGLGGYTAGPGWDPVTGLGSVDANALVTHWPVASAASPAVSLNTTTMNFGGQLIATASASQVVTLSNSGSAALTLTTTLSGANPGDFAASTTCGTTVSINGNCTFMANFKPTVAGPRTASITIVDNAPGSPHVIVLAGTGSTVAVPTITAIAPASIIAGSAAFTLTVNGANFVNGALVRWNGTNLTTSFVSATQLTAPVAASLVATVGNATITVLSGGQISTAATFGINPLTAGPSVLASRISDRNGIVNGLCALPPQVNSFITSSAAAWVYFELGNVTVGDTGTIQFLRPDGSVHQMYNVSAPFSDTCFSYQIGISGASAANYPGQWTVKAFWKQSAQAVVSLNFTLATDAASRTFAEPSGAPFLPVNPAVSCPGYYTSVFGLRPASHDGVWGAQVLLTSGQRYLQGGLNLGGGFAAAGGSPGFAAFTILNPAGESQIVSLSLNAQPLPGASNYTLGLTLQLLDANRNPVGPAVQRTGSAPFNVNSSLTVPPGFYILSIQSTAVSVAGTFQLSLSTSFTNRAGGAFQGGAVVGGYLISGATGAAPGFMGFCISEAQVVNVNAYSSYQYGTAGAGAVSLQINDVNGATYWSAPEPSPISSGAPLPDSVDMLRRASEVLGLLPPRKNSGPLDFGFTHQ